MKTTLEAVKAREQDYYLAHWEDGQLVMEPFCACGNALDEDYFCNSCRRECDCTFIGCMDPQSLSVVEKLIQGNPNFRNYRTSLIVK